MCEPTTFPASLATHPPTSSHYFGELAAFPLWLNTALIMVSYVIVVGGEEKTWRARGYIAEEEEVK